MIKVCPQCRGIWAGGRTCPVCAGDVPLVDVANRAHRSSLAHLHLTGDLRACYAARKAMVISLLGIALGGVFGLLLLRYSVGEPDSAQWVWRLLAALAFLVVAGGMTGLATLYFRQRSRDDADCSEEEWAGAPVPEPRVSSGERPEA